MSLSNQTSQANPAKRYISWKAGAGKLVYWDSEAKREVEIERPFKFAVLDELHAVSGFSESDNSGIYSNEVKDLSREKLVIRTGAGVLLEGFYGEIKDAIKAKGGKYTKSIYLATEIDGELAIANLKMSGAGFSAWIDFSKQGGVYGNWTIIGEGAVEGKKGATKFFMPKFSHEVLEDSDKDDAIKLDETLQSYIKSKSTAPQTEDLSRKLTQHEVLDTVLTDEDYEENKVDLSSIPF